MTRARARLRLLQLLHDAGHDADDDDLGRVLPGRAAAGAAAGGGARRCRSTTACELVRPLIAGRLRRRTLLLHVAVLLGYAAAGFYARHRASRARGFSELTHALGQVAAHHLHGDLVRGPVLPAAPLRLPRAWPRTASRIERFKVMERKLFWGIMTPGARADASSSASGCGSAGSAARAAGCTPRSRWSRCSSAITSGAGGCCATSPPSATARATSGSAGSTKFPVLILFATVFLVVFKPF